MEIQKESACVARIVSKINLFHVGSAAVLGIYAKNIVDVLGVVACVGIRGATALDCAADALCSAGWICRKSVLFALAFAGGYGRGAFL